MVTAVRIAAVGEACTRISLLIERLVALIIVSGAFFISSLTSQIYVASIEMRLRSIAIATLDEFEEVFQSLALHPTSVQVTSPTEDRILVLV